MASRDLSIVVQAKGAAQAAQAVGAVDRKVAGLAQRSGVFAANLKRNVSGALGTFTGRLKGLAGATVGLLGVGGLLGLAGAFKTAMEKAREFGDASIALARITGQSVDAASRMVDALDFFGIKGERAAKIAGMFTKNVGNLQATGKAAKFQKTYGLSILDSSGHLRKFNDQLAESADFFTNKHIPAGKKAAALAKLYGRNWQDLLPILAKGRKGVQDELTRSMHINEADLAAITASKQATREWDDALGDLETRIGIDLMPTITELVRTLTGFVQTHGPEIRDFFKNAVTTGKNFGGAVLDVVKGIQGVWNGIPEGVRDMLVKGFIADRTIKFLFGVSLSDLAGGAIKGVASGLGSALVQAGIGKAFVQPVFVTNMGAGVGGGPGGAAGGGLLPTLIGSAGVAGAVVLGAQSAGVIADGWTKGYDASQKGDFQGMFDSMKSIATDMEVVPGPIRDWLKGIFDNGQSQLDELKGPPAMSPDERDAANKLKNAVDNSKTAIIAAERNDRQAIVSAIKSSAPKVTVNVTVNGGRARVTKNYQHKRPNGGGGHTGGEQEFG